MGRVTDFMLQGRNTRLGIRKDATLANLCREGQWLIPQARSENQVAVLAFLMSISFTEEEDTYERNWNESLQQMQSLGGDGIRKRLLLLSWQAVIYWIWAERNSRLHRNSSRSSALLITIIERQVKDKISSYRDGNPGLSSSLMQSWFLACDRVY
ncbi:BnaC02g34820D [Brassica napus]|uniref:BnaC02g34820D protein n=1 Tax=Brassica napus TaxID=3708 RepID=A0A078HV09_BRANA|nr:BnaC02g34820D [Brassica napus]